MLTLLLSLEDQNTILQLVRQRAIEINHDKIIRSSDDEVMDFIWSQMKKSIQSELKSFNGTVNYINNIGFIFGLPFNNMIFMLFPVGSHSKNFVEHAFDIINDDNSGKFIVNFYRKI